MTNRGLAAIAVCWSLIGGALPAAAQDAVPMEILERTKFIKIGNEAGTAFTLDYRGKLYLVTARHVVAGVADYNAVIQVRQGSEWKDYHTIRTIYPASKDVDIAVFETGENATAPYSVKPLGSETTGGTTMGQQVWFIGFPYGLGSHLTGAKGTLDIPFIKRGTMSAVDGSNPDAVVIYIDGFNNPGFSGGPILFWEFSSHTYKILGVVKGYRFEPAKTVVNGQPVDTQILVNSGILIGYSIEHALEAIKQSQASKR